MKKLMCAVAAVAAGVALADSGIASANIVGYQGFTAEGSKMTAAVATFSKVGDDARTLGDYVPTKTASSAFSASNFILYFYKSSGAQLPVPEDTWIAETYPAAATAYKSAKVMIYWNATKQHWYLTADSRNLTYPMDDYPLNKGAGYMMKVGALTGGVTLTHNGEVDSEDYPFPAAANAMSFSGNIAPKDMVVSDFVPEKTASSAFSASNFILYFYKSSGAQLPVAEDSWIAENYPEAATAYKSAKVMIYWNATKQHWYLTADSRNLKYPMDDYPVKAGAGFMIKVGNLAGGVTLNLPNALD